MYTYFLILNDFGIRPQALWRLALLEGPKPLPDDTYNPDQVDPVFRYKLNADGTEAVPQEKVGSCRYGHCNIEEAEENWITIGWDATKSGKMDLRLFYANTDVDQRAPTDWTVCRFDPTDADLPKFYKFSHITDKPICYTTEALKYAQSGYLVSIVCVQWADLMICKTRNLSLAQQGMVNSFGNFGLFSETALVAILLYVPFLNIALGTRQIPFVHFAVPSFSFFVSIFFYDELRKIWLRSGMVRESGKLKLKGWIVQNTYY
jgi:sodium/potassium-transporting ATPase subunit alpha